MAAQLLWDRNPLPGRGKPRQPTSTNYLQPQTPATAKLLALSRLRRKQTRSLYEATAEVEARGAEAGSGVGGPGGDISPARPRAEAGPLLTRCAPPETGPAAEERPRGPSPGGKAQPPADRGEGRASPGRLPHRAGTAGRAPPRRQSVPPPVPPCRPPTGEQRPAGGGGEGGLIRGARLCPGRAGRRLCPPRPRGRLPATEAARRPRRGQSLLSAAARSCLLGRTESRSLPSRTPPAAAGLLPLLTLLTPLRCGASSPAAWRSLAAARKAPPRPAGRRGEASAARALPPPSAAARRPQPRSRPRSWVRRGRHLEKATCTAAAAPRPARQPIGAAGRGAAPAGAGSLPAPPRRGPARPGPPFSQSAPLPAWAGGTVSSTGGPSVRVRPQSCAVAGAKAPRPRGLVNPGAGYGSAGRCRSRSPSGAAAALKGRS